MKITQDTALGRLVGEHPLTTRVLSRHRIDFCCGGRRTLGETCRAADLDPEALIAELQAALDGTPDAPRSWLQAPLSELIDHILTTFHAPLADELPRLEALAEKVCGVHRERDPERFDELLSVVRRVRAEMEQHMPKEEEVLFPAILAGAGARLQMPISVMEEEHEALGELLHRLRELTDDYAVPAEACNSWRALWAGLEALERDTHEHIHLENNVLHVRARSG